ncbi:PREDICTED: probable protein phosphatase 2C 18 [Camelina sativa]|uniref:Probable protein phosphatase 2C 18 n=1 Tax=Camelina sativa TaxID=90675 RepID=A0ABM1RMQ5_CAMSA|nr:PREDICTED: probable protein phosphatase 2C 18 [Camelina sativa]
MGLCYSVDRTTGKETGETSTTASATETADERLGSRRWRRPRYLMGGGEIEQVLGRFVSNGSSKVAFLYTQQGKKGTNQDAMLVFESMKRICKGEYNNVDPRNTECLKLVEEFEKCIDRINESHIIAPDCEENQETPPDCYVIQLAFSQLN